MSGDEVMVLLFSAVVAAFAWYRWYAGAMVRTLVIRNASRFIFIAAPVACLAMLFIVLRQWAADDVRDSETYLAFYMVAGGAWIGLCAQLCCVLGISPRDDAVERQNLAAAFATAGAMAGITFCFAGANVGNGPGWWVVVFSAALSTGTFFVLWALVENLTGVSERVTIDRADGTGLRFGGFLVATGLILGRAVAGDWVSADATVRDFVTVAWPVLPLAGAEVIIGRVSSSDGSAGAEDSLTGPIVAAVFVAASSVYVFVWRGMP
jgi:hypothetical protein